MIITKLEEKSPERIFLYLDGEYETCVNKTICEKFGLVEGKVVAKEELLPLLEAAMVRKARTRALYLLDRQGYTRKKLREKLLATNEAQFVEAALDDLERVGILDDLAYARLLSEELIRYKAASNRKILSVLYARGVSGSALQQIKEELPTDESERVCRLLRQKYKQFSDEVPEKVKAALFRQGFSSASVKRGIGLFLEEI